MLKSLKSPQEPEVSRSELLQAIGELSVAFSDGTIDQLQPTGPAAVYTSSVTLWMLVMQRLASGNTLNAIVKDFIANRPAFCPQNRRLDEGTLSESSGAYAGARKRIELETIKYLFHRVSDSFSKTTSSLEFRRRQTFLLDGTTITLAPTEELKRHFPPATNQHGESVWPIMLLFVAHDLEDRQAVTAWFDRDGGRWIGNLSRGLGLPSGPARLPASADQVAIRFADQKGDAG
jgi:hypothetical protein